MVYMRHIPTKLHQFVISSFSVSAHTRTQLKTIGCFAMLLTSMLKTTKSICVSYTKLWLGTASVSTATMRNNEVLSQRTDAIPRTLPACTSSRLSSASWSCQQLLLADLSTSPQCPNALAAQTTYHKCHKNHATTWLCNYRNT